MQSLNSPSTVIFAYPYSESAPGTVPVASYGNITIASGAHYQYIGNKSISTSWASTLTVDGTFSLNQDVLYSFAIGSGTSGKVSQLLGTGVINGTQGLKFGGLITQMPIDVIFNGTMSGIMVAAPINLLANLTMTNQCYFSLLGTYIDLNAQTLEVGSLNGKEPENIKFKNSWAGNLIIRGDALGLASSDALPFNNITLGGNTTLTSNIKLEGTLTNNSSCIFNLGDYTVNLPEPNSLKNNGTITPTSGIHYGVNSVINTSDQLVKVFPSMSSDYIKIECEASNFDNNSNVDIIDLTGKTCIKIHNLDNLSFINIPVVNLANGMYIVKITNRSKTYKQRFIKI